ncbi:hypothetical protein PFISCL1PPCAC_21054, partial [Pristionchus fissidentatus]
FPLSRMSETPKKRARGDNATEVPEDSAVFDSILRDALVAKTRKVDELESENSALRAEVAKLKEELRSTANSMKVAIGVKNRKIRELEEDETTIPVALPAQKIAVREPNNIFPLTQKDGYWILRVKFDGAASFNDEVAPYLISPTFDIEGLQWSIIGKRFTVKDVPFVSIFLKASCDSDDDWSCAFTEKYNLISFNSATHLHKTMSEITVYNNQVHDLGYDLISVKDLLNDSRKFVHMDSFLLEIHLKLFVSH